MAKQTREKVNGWLLFDKPLHMTSNQALGYLKRVFQAQKAGHSGTLDPLATGLLAVALGEATKAMPYMISTDKTYEFTVKWGETTTTDDLEGEVVEQRENRPLKAEVEAVLPQFTGAIQQIPPIFSAIKSGGVPAYKKARAGEAVTMQPRAVEVYDLVLLSCDTDFATFRAHVSKGTYIRSLARDMGEALGCLGRIETLRRTQIDQFSVEGALTQEMLDRSLEKGEDARQFLLPIDAVLDDIPVYHADPQELMQLKQGLRFQRIHLRPGLMRVQGKDRKTLSLVQIDAQGEVSVVRNFNVE